MCGLLWILYDLDNAGRGRKRDEEEGRGKRDEEERGDEEEGAMRRKERRGE